MTQYKLVIDCSTGKQEYIELTAAEIAEKDQFSALMEEERIARQKELEKMEALKQSAKTKLIAGKPLTDEEAAAIVI